MRPESPLSRLTPSCGTALKIRHGMFFVKGIEQALANHSRIDFSRKAAADSVRPLGRWWISLPNEGFKGILAEPAGRGGEGVRRKNGTGRLLCRAQNCIVFAGAGRSG